MKLSILLLAGAVLCSTVLRASEITISNYGTGYGNGSALGIDIADGASFIAPTSGVPGFSYALSSIEIVAYTTTQDANPVSISLYDSLGGLPHNPLETLYLNVLDFVEDAPLSTYVVSTNSITMPHLIGGAQYWFVLSDALSGDVTWVSDGNGSTNPAVYVSTEDFVGWTLLGESYAQGSFSAGFDLAPDNAPEPGTFVALGSGLAAVALFTRRRARKQAV
jgi:hypothetical protein